MPNCNSISNTQTVTITGSTLTSGFCLTSLQSTFDEFITKTSGTLGSYNASFFAGDWNPDGPSGMPPSENNSKLWFRVDANDCNKPLGWYMYSSDTSSWVPLRSGPPVGSISMWYTSTAPTDWLICDGTTFSATDYPDLNTLLGGNTLPDLKGRMPIGVGQQSNTKWDSTAETYTADGTDFALAGSGGTEDHKLLEAEIPSHDHGMPTSENGMRTTTNTLGGNNDHAVSGGGAVGKDTFEAFGGTSPHNNLPPYLALNFIICAK